MRLYAPITKVDAEQRMVYGYASTEAEDDQGETITLGALSDALDDYMRFANIREMHQLSAVGTAQEAAIDDKGLYVGAHVVDPRAWEKVTSGVYKGFSVGGKVKARDPHDRSIITGLALTEISLVDRPANPEAIFDCWKRGGEAMAVSDDDIVIPSAELGPLRSFFAKLGFAKGGDEPGDGKKPYGDVEYADPGYQDDKKKRYPLDTEKHIRAAWNYIHKPKNAAKYTAEQVKSIKAKIVAAWKDKIDKDGPPEAKDDSGKAATVASLAKGMEDIGRIARLVEEMFWLWEKLETERAMEGDDSPLPDDLKALIAQVVAFQQQHAGEETEEFLDGTETPVLPLLPYGTAPFCWAAHVTSLRKSGHEALADRVEQLASAEAQPAKGVTMTDIQKRSDGDQHLMDVGHAAIHKALSMDGMNARERGHMVQACEAMKAAGAGEDGSADIHSTQNTAGAATHPAPTKGGADPTGKAAAIDLIIDTLAKRAQGHQHLMDLAHECCSKLTDGATCKDDAGKAARHSQETLDHLHKAHFHLCAAGAKCDAAMPEPKDDKGAAATGDDLAKALATQIGDALSPIVGRLDALASDVAAIKQTPLPAQTVRTTDGLTRFTKGSDGAAEPVVVDVVDALSKMSDEDRNLTLIKMARRLPNLELTQRLGGNSADRRALEAATS